jgi:cation diffusion facilitator family transporter
MTDGLFKKALYLEYFTVGYNVIEGVLSILAGYLAGSIALIGFGLDSAVESASGGVLIWRLTRHGRVSEEEEERVERTAVKLVGASFFLLGAYVLYESVKKLYLQEQPEPSLFGIIIAAASIIVMPLLAYSKRRIARKINSRSLEADSKQTLICSLLSVALLLGLGLNYLFGLWWADPLSALVIVFFIFREGVEAFRAEKLCSC